MTLGLPFLLRKFLPPGFLKVISLVPPPRPLWSPRVGDQIMSGTFVIARNTLIVLGADKGPLCTGQRRGTTTFTAEAFAVRVQLMVTDEHRFERFDHIRADLLSVEEKGRGLSTEMSAGWEWSVGDTAETGEDIRGLECEPDIPDDCTHCTPVFSPHNSSYLPWLDVMCIVIQATQGSEFTGLPHVISPSS